MIFYPLKTCLSSFVTVINCGHTSTDIEIVKQRSNIPESVRVSKQTVHFFNVFFYFDWFEVSEIFKIKCLNCLSDD